MTACVLIQCTVIYIFHPLHYRADFSTPAFSTPCLFLLLRADISTPAFSTPAFPVPRYDSHESPSLRLACLACLSKNLTQTCWLVPSALMLVVNILDNRQQTSSFIRPVYTVRQRQLRHTVPVKQQSKVIGLSPVSTIPELTARVNGPS